MSRYAGVFKGPSQRSSTQDWDIAQIIVAGLTLAVVALGYATSRPPLHRRGSSGVPGDGNRYELVHVELVVTLAPRLRHHDVAGDLYFRLRTYLGDRAEVRVFFSPVDIRWADDVLVEPHVFVAPASQTRF